MKMSKKVLSILLSVLLIVLTVSCLSVCVFAAGDEGTDGNISWTYYASSKTLKLTGNGPMNDYRGSNAPWGGKSYTTQTIVIEPGITRIGNNAFLYFHVTSVTIPDTVTSIGDSSFHHCDALESIAIPYSMKEINYSAFSDCTGLKSVTIPFGTEKIGANAFEGCSALRTVTIPKTVKEVGFDAFRNCTMPETVNYGGSEAQWNNIDMPYRDTVFEGCPNYHMNFNYVDPNAQSFAVVVNIDPPEGGTVAGGGAFARGEITQLEATPNPGFVFVGFTDEAGQHVKFVNRFSVTKDVLYTAKFMSTANLAELRKDTDPLDDGDWYFDTEAFLEGMANQTGVSVEDLRPLYAEYWQENVAKFDPNSGLIVIGPAGDTNYAEQSATCPGDDGYSIYRNAIKVYQGSGDNGSNNGQNQSGCPWCGGVHEGFFQGIIGFFHGIFAKIFGARY